MQRPWIDEVGHSQLTDTPQSLDHRGVQELDLFGIERYETVDRIAQLNGHVIVLSLSFDSPSCASHPSPAKSCLKV
jgi:hypothetical protein